MSLINLPPELLCHIVNFVDAFDDDTADPRVSTLKTCALIHPRMTRYSQQCYYSSIQAFSADKITLFYNKFIAYPHLGLFVTKLSFGLNNIAGGSSGTPSTDWAYCLAGLLRACPQLVSLNVEGGLYSHRRQPAQSIVLLRRTMPHLRELRIVLYRTEFVSLPALAAIWSVAQRLNRLSLQYIWLEKLSMRNQVDDLNPPGPSPASEFPPVRDLTLLNCRLSEGLLPQDVEQLANSVEHLVVRQAVRQDADQLIAVLEPKVTILRFRHVGNIHMTEAKLARLSNYTALQEFTLGCSKHERYNAERDDLYRWMSRFFVYLNSPLLERVYLCLVWRHVMTNQDEFDLDLSLVLESLFSQPRLALRILHVSVLHEHYREEHAIADKAHVNNQARAYQDHLQALHGSDLLRIRVQVIWAGLDEDDNLG